MELFRREAEPNSAFSSYTSDSPVRQPCGFIWARYGEHGKNSTVWWFQYSLRGQCHAFVPSLKNLKNANASVETLK